LIALAAAPLRAADFAAVKHSTNWIVNHGADGGKISFTLNGAATEAQSKFTVRVSLRPVGAANALWTLDKEITLGADGKASAEFPLDIRRCDYGDHGVVIAVAPVGTTTFSTREYALMVADPDDAVIVFTNPPVQRGVKFDPHDIQASEVEIQGAKTPVHKMNFGSQQGGEGWWRSILFTLTDAAQRNGARPGAEVEIAYTHPNDQPVNIKIDTVNGSQEIAATRGTTGSWKVLRGAVTNARFAAPTTGADPKDLAAEKCDLRFNACTADGTIRSLRIHLPNLKNPTDWSRFLTA
jgi:hypothetical protein